MPKLTITERVRIHHPDVATFESAFLPQLEAGLAQFCGEAEIKVAAAVLTIMDLYASERHIGIHKAMAFELALSTLLPEHALSELQFSNDIVEEDALRPTACVDTRSLSFQAPTLKTCPITMMARVILAAARVMSDVPDQGLRHVEKGALLATSRDSFKFMHFMNGRLGAGRNWMGELGLPEDDAHAIKRILRLVEGHLPKIDLRDPDREARLTTCLTSTSA